MKFEDWMIFGVCAVLYAAWAVYLIVAGNA